MERRSIEGAENETPKALMGEVWGGGVQLSGLESVVSSPTGPTENNFNIYYGCQRALDYSIYKLKKVFDCVQNFKI